MSYRLLLIDDSEDLQKLVSMFLERNGYEVLRASNARKACANWQRVSLI